MDFGRIKLNPDDLSRRLHQRIYKLRVMTFKNQPFVGVFQRMVLR